MNGILKHSSSHCGEHYLHLVDNIPFFFSAVTIRRGGGFKIYFAHAGRKVRLMPFQNYDAGYKTRQERMKERERKREMRFHPNDVLKRSFIVVANAVSPFSRSPLSSLSGNVVR